MSVNDDAGCQQKRVGFKLIASKLAPKNTVNCGGEACPRRRLLPQRNP